MTGTTNRYLFNAVHDLGTSRRGSVSILTAATLAVLLAFAAIAVDVSHLFYQRRIQQGANDLAVIAAASNLANSRSAAEANIRVNGLDAASLSRLELGVYTPTLVTAPENRFVVTTTGTQNAARVTMTRSVPSILATVFSVLGDRSNSFSSAAITTSATAALTGFTTFSIGSRLVSLDGGIANAVLGAMLGSSLSLTAMDYQAMAQTNVDLFRFSNALATRASLTGITYDQLAHSNVNVGNILAATADAVVAGSDSTTAIAALTQIATAQSYVTLAAISPMINFGPYASMSVGSQAPITATMSALDIVSAIAQLANGTHQVQTALAVNLPGVLAANLSLTMGERPVGSALVQLGGPGASAHTAQTRMLLTLQIGVPGQAFTINLPLYVEIAQGTARFAALNCAPWSMQNASVTLGVTPGVVTGWIGDVTSAMMTDYTTSPNPSATTLVNIANLATVTGRATASISNMAETSVAFTYADVQNKTKKTTATTDYTASLLASLIGNLQLSVNALGLGLGLPNNLTSTISQTLSGQATNIDQILSSLLAVLGLELGSADTWITGLSCGNAVLVY